MQQTASRSLPNVCLKGPHESVRDEGVNIQPVPTLSVEMKNIPGPEPVLPIVLIHGLLSTPREFGLISLPLQSRGAPLIILNIPGYTEADRSQFKRWSSWVNAACDAIREQFGSDQPFVLGGLCSGGMVAAAVAARGEFNVRSLVMMSPSFGYDGWARTKWWGWRKVAHALGVDRWISVRESEPYGIKNEKIRKWVERDMHMRATSAAGPSTLPLWAINQSERLMRHVTRQFPRLRMPTVVMHSRLDEICSLGLVKRVFDTLPLGANRLVVFDNSYHMITIDNDRQQVTAELLKCSGHAADRSAAVPVDNASGAPKMNSANEQTATDAYTGVLLCPTP
jgi:carboxylesterase